ncbi:MAG TPA: nuclear transport factor 2 family protein [Noviherbaspirillum sp.]|jgi:ketosteroid isomerase-like protein|uniref:nuclear transport factor 2 family protein n=1 Tax=Noviherbaspirillum sp. TaxID=1926288 RepID=UPI002F92877F
MRHLPAPIAAYVRAANTNDTLALAACFTADAVVRDEAQSHFGIAAIAAWQSGANRRYHPTVEASRIEGADQNYLMHARVTGDFPGSPVMLAYRFVLRGDRIASMEISA